MRHKTPSRLIKHITFTALSQCRIVKVFCARICRAKRKNTFGTKRISASGVWKVLCSYMRWDVLSIIMLRCITIKCYFTLINTSKMKNKKITILKNVHPPHITHTFGLQKSLEKTPTLGVFVCGPAWLLYTYFHVSSPQIPDARIRRSFRMTWGACCYAFIMKKLFAYPNV